MIAVAFVGVGGQYFPIWGGMFFPARKGYTEEDFYFAEYSVAERERGMHLASSAFVSTLQFFLAPWCSWVHVASCFCPSLCSADSCVGLIMC